MGNALLGLSSWFSGDIGLTLEESEIDIRQNIQSPGRLELITKKIAVGAFILAVLGVITTGGHIKSDTFIHIDAEMKGIGPIVIEAIEKNNREKRMAEVLAVTLPKMSAEQGLDAMRILANQAPTTSEAVATTAAKSTAKADSSAAVATAATASLATPPKSPTLAAPTASAPTAPAPKPKEK